MNIHIDDPRLIDLLNKFDSPTSFLSSMVPVMEYCISTNKPPSELFPDLLENLYKLFPDYLINNLGTHFAMTHHSSPTLFIQQKHYNFNIPPADSNEFINLCKNNDVSGILCSQNSGIANHPDLSFDIFDNNIIVFVHNLNGNPLKIKYAHKIIECLSDYIDSLEQPTELCIDPTQFENIKKDYESLIFNIQKLEKQLKDCSRTVSDLHFDSIQNLLQTKSSVHPSLHRRHICVDCKKSYKNKSSLNRHITEFHTNIKKKTLKN